MIEKIREWIFNPVKFVEEMIHPPKITTQQRNGLKEYGLIIQAKMKRAEGVPLNDKEKHYASKRGLSIMAGQGVGKDAFAAWCILHFLFCMPHCKVLCTAPTGPQLRVVLWTEIHKWLRISGSLKNFITWQAEKVFFTELEGKEWYAVPRTISTSSSPEEQAETLAGLHEDFMLYICDEASGIPDPVYKPIEGSMTGKCNFAIVIFNPTKSYGYAIETQRKNRDEWVCLHWDGEESELVEATHIAASAAKYGKDSNWYRIRIRGLPPLSDDDTIIPLSWVLKCVNLDLLPDENDLRVAGLDVSGQGGDESILIAQRGNLVETIEATSGLRTDDLAYWAFKHIETLEIEGIAIDVIGLGAGVYDTLDRMASFPVMAVNVAQVPEWNEDKFVALRDELWWSLRERFEKSTISIPHDDELIAQLSIPKYEEIRGKIKVESKRDMRKRSVASPDRADALCLAEYMRRMFTNRRPTKFSRSMEPVSWKII